jgi:micrococcal nuclease
MYERNVYRCKLRRIIDGDTVELDVDLGLRIHRTLTLRLGDIDAPEVRGPERKAGLDATETLRDLIQGESLCVRFAGDKSFDRWVGTLYIEREGELVDVNDAMVILGAAEASE